MVRTLLIGDHFFLLITKFEVPVTYQFQSCERMQLTSHKNISNLSFSIYGKLILWPYLLWLLHMLFMYPIFILEKADRISWQIVELSRQFFGMSELEKATESGGSLSVHIGDALSLSATVEGGFAGE